MDTVNYFSQYEKITAVLNSQGAFLTVKDRSDRLNVMVIGWGLIGIVWRDPIFMVAVRPSRYTFSLLENANDFTVTIPFSDMDRQLSFCGTHSGRNIDKFKETGLQALNAKSVNSPVIAVKQSRYYECEIVQVSAMDKNRLCPQYDKNLYQDKSYHTYYFGKIIACYEEP